MCTIVKGEQYCSDNIDGARFCLYKSYKVERRGFTILLCLGDDFKCIECVILFPSVI